MIVNQQQKLAKAKIGMPIFKRLFHKTLKSKIFIIMTILFTVALIFTNILFSFINNVGYPNGNMYTYISLCIMAVYLTYFEIHNISSNFSQEMKSGIMNLEIRSGISKSRIFFERVLVNKIWTTLWISMMLAIFVLTFSLSPNILTKDIASSMAANLCFIYVFDLIFFAILLMFTSGSGTILMGVIGTLLSIFLILMPIFSMLSSMLGKNDSPENNNLNIVYSKVDEINKYTKKDPNNKIEKLISEYANLEIKDINDIKFIDSNGKELDVKPGAAEFQVKGTGNNNNYTYVYDIHGMNEFVFDVINEGLILDIDKLTFTVSGIAGTYPPTLAHISLPKEVEKNNLYKFFKNIHESSKLHSSIQDWNNTYFAMKSYSDADTYKEFYTGNNNLNLLKYSNDNNLISNSEFNTMHSFIADIAKNYYKASSSSNNERLGYIRKSAFDNKPVSEQNFVIEKTYSNADPRWINEVSVSTNERIFTKVSMDLIRNTLNLRPSKYTMTSAKKTFIFNAEQYYTKAKNKALWNPLEMTSQMMFNSSLDSDYGFTQASKSLFGNPNSVNNIYKVVGSEEEPSIGNVLNGIPFTEDIIIDYHTNYGSDYYNISRQFVENIFNNSDVKKQLKNLTQITDSEFSDLFQSWGTSGGSEKLFNIKVKSIEKYQSKDEQDNEKEYAKLQISLEPKGEMLKYLKSEKTLITLEKVNVVEHTLVGQETQRVDYDFDKIKSFISSNFDKESDDVSTPESSNNGSENSTVFSKFAKRNYEDIQYVGNTQRAYVGYIIYITISITISSLSFLIFYKKIVR